MGHYYTARSLACTAGTPRVEQESSLPYEEEDEILCKGLTRLADVDIPGRIECAGRSPSFPFWISHPTWVTASNPCTDVVRLVCVWRPGQVLGIALMLVFNVAMYFLSKTTMVWDMTL